MFSNEQIEFIQTEVCRHWLFEDLYLMGLRKEYTVCLKSKKN